MLTCIDSQQAESLASEAAFAQLESSPAELSSRQASERLAQFGRNALEEKKVSPLANFLGSFWGPIPWTIEVAAILSAITGDADDLTIILVLLAFNAPVGFWEEHKGANALDALERCTTKSSFSIRETETNHGQHASESTYRAAAPVGRQSLAG